MGLRIAVLSRNFACTGGGAERYSIAVVEQLASRHEVHVFAQNIEHDFPGVSYHRVAMPLRRPRWINQLYFAAATWWATRKGFDIVHSHENTWHGNVQTVHVLPIKHTLFTGKLGLGLGLRWLKVITSPRLLAYLWLESSRYRPQSGRQVVVTSEPLRETMISAYPNAEPMLSVITPGVQSVEGRISVAQRLGARERLQLPPDVPMLLLVGNDMRKKGLPTLLGVLQQLPDLHLTVVGHGDHTGAMRDAARTLAGRVHFLGAMSEVADAYRAADILVHPTLEDTYAMVVLEAMSHGLPVVVSGPKFCGISADLQNGVNAILVADPRDIGAFATAIEKLRANAEFAAGLVAHGLDYALAHTWDATGREYERLMIQSTRAPHG